MLNLNRLKKDEILWMYNHFCKHGHRYVEHIACYEKDRGSLKGCPISKERVGHCDIEATNLHATFGYIFSYCIKEHHGKMLEYCLSPREIRDAVFDKNLMVQFNRDVRQFDRIVVYWGKNYRFDVPFLRTRASKWSVEFPAYKALFVTDMYDVVKSKLRLHSNRLQTVCEFFDIPCKGHRLNPEVWQKAMSGNKKALDFIREHNREDVISLEGLWDKLEPYFCISRTSI